MISLFLIFWVSSFLSWALCWPTKKWLKRNELWDKPNDRSSHVITTLRGGGLAPLILTYVGIFLFVVPLNPALALTWIGGLSLLSWVSFCDDRGDVPIVRRLAAQIISVLLILWAMSDKDIPLGSLIMVGVGMVAYINFVNFMDGINGLVTGLMVLISLGILFLVPELNLMTKAMLCVLGGAALGFLPFNFPRAKMFLGDVGSITFGYNSGVLVLLGIANSELESAKCIIILIPMYFFLEGFVAIARRMVSGKKWWLPHREHYYQRLIRSGETHTRTALLMWSGQVIVMVILWLSLKLSWEVFIACISSGLVWMLIFTYAEFKLKKSNLNT